MKTFPNHQIGIDDGVVALFSDFEDDGDMWKGDGPRAVSHAIIFAQSYAAAPSVTVHFSMIDMSNDAFIRADLQAENVSTEGFNIVFRTWGDSRVARIRVAWQAIGAVQIEDNWDL